MDLKVAGPNFEQIMWEWAWENACPREWGCRKKAQDLVQPYKTNGSTNGLENTDIASFNVKFYKCEKRIGWFDSGVEKLAAQNVASQGPVHDCKSETTEVETSVIPVPFDRGRGWARHLGYHPPLSSPRAGHTDGWRHKCMKKITTYQKEREAKKRSGQVQECAST